MDKFPKYVVEDGNLVMMKVSYHREIVQDRSKVRGGGWFRLDSEKKAFTFHGDSHDFGKASLEDVARCVKEKRVFTNYYLTHDISEKYDFFYDTGTETINLKTHENS